MTRNAAIATRSVEMFLVVLLVALPASVILDYGAQSGVLIAAGCAIVEALQQISGLTALGVHDGDGRTVPPGVGR